MISQNEIDEVFRRPAVREVACEIRFAPRLRVVPEIWRVQDKLAEAYPQLGEEELSLPGLRPVRTYVFANPADQRMIKISQENCVVIFNRYTTFEDFKAEAVARISDFSRQFDIANYQRVGLRYVNHLDLAPEDPLGALQIYVNLPVDLGRFDRGTMEQFMTEFRLQVRAHKLTIRSAFVRVPTPPQQMLYILDLDCYGFGPCTPSVLPNLLDEFHREIQIQFLEHVRAEYKRIMRGNE